MAGKVLLATTGNGIARAECRAGGQWSIDFLIKGQDVRCLSALEALAVAFRGYSTTFSQLGELEAWSSVRRRCVITSATSSANYRWPTG